MVNSYVAHAVTSVGTAIVYFIHPFGSLVRHVPNGVSIARSRGGAPRPEGIGRDGPARGRTGGRGSGLLKLADVDLKISVENAATVALAKKLNLVA